MGIVPRSHLDGTPRVRNRSAVLVYAVVDDALSPDFPLGVELEVFIRREDAGAVRGDRPRVRELLRELEQGGLLD